MSVVPAFPGDAGRLVQRLRWRGNARIRPGVHP